MSPGNVYDDAELLAQLQRVKDETGACTPASFNNHPDTASASAVMRRFGSWTEAKEQAGITEDLTYMTGRDKQYSDEEVLEDIRTCAERNDGNCTVEQMNAADDLCGATIAVDRFGSWSAAKEEAGIDPDARSGNHRPRKYSDDDYLEMLRECEDRHDKVTQKIFNEDPEFPSANAVRKRFGTWSNAKDEAGIETQGTYSDEELLEMLRNCKERHGKTTTSVFAADENYCSPETVQRRFGSWSEAKELAGL